MKKFSKLALFTIFALCLGFSAWQPQESRTNITKFYYYQNQPFQLNLKTDMLFVKLSRELTENEFRTAVSSIGTVSLNSAQYIPSEKRYFISLGSAKDDAALIEITDRLNLNPDVLYTSPVFSPDNGNTLIGMEGEILVQFKPNVTSGAINSYLSNKNMNIIKDMGLTGGASYLVKVPQNISAIDGANDLYRSGLTNWAEPNLLFTNVACFIPNDTYFPQQWSVINQGNNIPGGITGTPDSDLGVDTAWNITLGLTQCKIAISDSGVDTLHEDLAANMVLGSGYDFWNNDPYAWDDYNHGTCCAGIVAAVGNNNLGISGVAPNCKLIPVKWIAASGNGNYAGATNSTVWAYQQGAWVISNSWGFVGGASAALDQAILDACNLGRGGKGTLFVVASGNENGAMRFPASTNPNVLVVGGLSPCYQRKAPSSCDLENFWGASYGANIDVVAPCVKIYATDRTGSVGYTSGNYQPIFNGTSSATPNVAGVCALAFSLDSNMRWDTLRVRVDRSCRKVGSYTYDQPGPRNVGLWNLEMGYGLVNANALLLSIQQFTGISNNNSTASEFSLNQNYPNPFNPSTSISYSVPKAVNVTIKIFDIQGKEVATLVNGMKQQGSYTVDFNASDLASGVYFYRIDAGDFTSIKKMALVK